MAGSQIQHHLEKDDVFAGYTIVQFCGSGAYGEVYLAEDITHKVVALKIIPIASGSNVWRMELIGLRHYRQSIENHKALIEVLHVGETENFFYYTMEAADNMLHGDFSEEYIADTLAHRLERGGRLEPEKVLELANNLLDALEHLSEYDLAHRDIKPANIVFINGQPKLSDIGLISNTGVRSKVVGTLDFLPPEIADGDPVGYGHDLYSLGKVLYCALTGLLPENFPEVPITVPLRAWRQFKNVLLKACSPDPRNRFFTPEAFRAALPSSIRETTFIDEELENLRSYRKQHPVTWRLSLISVILVFIAMALGVILALSQKHNIRIAKKNQIDFIYKTIDLLNDREVHINRIAAITGNQARAWRLKTVAEMAANARTAGDWDTTERYCRLADSTLRLWSEEEFRILQLGIPQDPLPENNSELFEALMKYRNFQASPLAENLADISAGDLDSTVTLLQEKLAEKWAGPLPGLEWFFPQLPDMKFKYIPAGGLPGEPASGYWMADCEVTGRLLKTVMPNHGLELEDNNLPATGLSWNDRIDFCRILTLKAQKLGILPENYIIRLPYYNEWNFVLQGAWTSAGNFIHENENIKDFAWHGGNSMYQPQPVRQLSGGTLGIYDMLGNAAESVLQKATQPGQTPRIINCGASFRDRRISNIIAQKCDIDMLENKWSGFRLVIAPGNMDYFENNWFTGQEYIIKDKLDIYELLGGKHSRWQSRIAGEWNRLLGSQPVILQDAKLRNRLFRASGRLQNLPLITSAIRNGQQWQWQDRTLVDNGEWLNNHDNHLYDAMTWDHGFWSGISNSDTAPLTMIKYASKGYHAPRLGSVKSPLILSEFKFKGKHYFLLKSPVDWYTAKRLAELLGGTLAIPANSAETTFMAKKLKSYKNLRIALGGYRKNGKWRWLNNTSGPGKVQTDKSAGGSLNSRFIGIYNGKLCNTQKFDAFLCEIR
ncbi:MAG: SUMF1/EgtB/PvdO family nonheme iron enzyme [Lentisphaeria bacterium]|nr:hypothetical protein [Lentisphaerota bacterium]MBR7144191.1 SUMF1/EgtB/PvdO family nonheme iron enzyme [Lentisphaeria bacterium]